MLILLCCLLCVFTPSIPHSLALQIGILAILFPFIFLAIGEVFWRVEGQGTDGCLGALMIPRARPSPRGCFAAMSYC